MVVRSWTDEELEELAGRLDNNGRWGPDDELGTLNHITATKRVEAAGLVRSGRVVSLARPLVPDESPSTRVDLEHRVVYARMPDVRLGTPPFAGDYLGVECHQPGVTHLDAIGHIGSLDGRTWGGRSYDEAVDDDGLHFGSIQAQGHGVVSRAVLLDIPASQGKRWLDPAAEIGAADLEVAVRHAGVEVGPGDVIVVRVGIEARQAAHGSSVLAPGPGAEAAEWIHRRDVACYVSDAPEHITALGARILGRGEVRSDPAFDRRTRFPLTFHQLALPLMGLCLLDHAHVETLAEVCAEIGRYEFLFIAAPLVVPRATGSPVNPLAIF